MNSVVEQQRWRESRYEAVPLLSYRPFRNFFAPFDLCFYDKYYVFEIESSRRNAPEL